MATSTWQVRDELWEAVRPLLPEHRADPRGGPSLGNPIRRPSASSNFV